MSEVHRNKCPRASIVLPDLRGGGAERVSLDPAVEFCSRGYPVDLVLMRAEGEILELVPGNARVVDLRVPRVRDVVGPLTSNFRRERPVALLAAMWPLTSCTVVAPRLARARRCRAGTLRDAIPRPATHRAVERPCHASA